MDLPELVLVNVLARFPLKNIAGFRLISKDWKSLLDSNYFRDYYISFNSSSSVSWSIIPTSPKNLSLDIVSHYKCKTWGLTRSPGSYFSFLVETPIKELEVLACTNGLVLVYAEARDGSPLYYVGNPLFQEWVCIPLPGFLTLQEIIDLRNNYYFINDGLVTKIENGIVVSYKVVWMLGHKKPSDNLDFMVYSSETGVWETEKVRATVWSRPDKCIALNGILHWTSMVRDTDVKRYVVAHDFFGGNYEDECRIVPFPSKGVERPCFMRQFRKILTTSEGSIVYFNEFREKGNHMLRVWMMVKYVKGPEAWQLAWEINLAPLRKFGVYGSPVAMHPLKSEIIYLWSIKQKALTVFNLSTHESSRHEITAHDTECKEYNEEVYGCYLKIHRTIPHPGFFSQYVFPRWMQRLPRTKHV